MKIDISAVTKTAGARMDINESEVIEDLNDIYGIISITQPVVFKGTLTNQLELLRLEGLAQCTYETQCDNCGRLITREHKVDIKEDLFEERLGEDRASDNEQFTYQGNWLELDKILSDNIALSLPMHHRCEEKCAIICPECGEPVTGSGCGCNKVQPIDPRLAALKDLLDQQQADKAD